MLPPVHAGGAFCGSLVPEGNFCPQKRYLLWTRRENVAACPRIGCPAWKQGAGSNLLGTRR